MLDTRKRSELSKAERRIGYAGYMFLGFIVGGLFLAAMLLASSSGVYMLYVMFTSGNLLAMALALAFVIGGVGGAATVRVLIDREDRKNDTVSKGEVDRH